MKATTAVFCQTTYYSNLKQKVATLRLCLGLLLFFVKNAGRKQCEKLFLNVQIKDTNVQKMSYIYET